MFKWFKYLFAPKQYRHGIEYEIIDTVHLLQYPAIFCLSILKGPYKGVIFGVTDFRQLDSYGKMTYNYTVIRGNVDKAFEDVADMIVVDSVKEAIQQRSAISQQILKDINADDFDNYSEESFTE